MNENGNVNAVQLQIPAVALNNCSFQVQRQPNGDAVILMGPIMLALPLTAETKRALVEALTGVVVAGAQELP
jgi:hypothetical protein